MAVYTADSCSVKIIIGEVTASQDTSMAGTFASESSAYLSTLDSTIYPAANISTTIEQKWDNGTKYVFTCTTFSDDT